MVLDKKSDKTRYVYVFFTLLAACCGVVWAFTNLGYDCEYEISMCYRLLQGDKMFLEMWEPHQTSAYLPAALMWIYLKLTGSTTGIVLYLQVCGIIIRGALSFLLYRTLKGDLEKPVAYGMALLYFMISPKEYALPEFGNLQLWFSTLLFCCLWSYLKTNKVHLLVLGAFSLCLEVLTYPSCAIVFFGVIALLAKYSPLRKRDILLFTGICAVLGMMVAGYFLFTIGPDTLKLCITGMFALEPSHTGSPITKLIHYGRDILVQAGILLAAGGIGFVVCQTFQLIFIKDEKRQRVWRWLLCSSIVLLVGFLANILSVENRWAYSVILLFITGMGLWNAGKLRGDEKKSTLAQPCWGNWDFLPP